MELKQNTDSTTLKNVSGKEREPKLLLETLKPSISSLPQSNLLQRLRGFLPEMEAANKDLTSSSVMDFEVVHCVDSSSNSEDESSSDELSDEEDKTNVDKPKQYVQLDLNLFKARDEVVTQTDPEVQTVEEVPEAFREPSSDENKSPKKNLIEVIDP